MYKVLEYFTDLQDNDYPYEVGSYYPREGLEITEDRLVELSTTKNKRGIILIAKEEIEDVEEVPLSELSLKELQNIAKEQNIKNYKKLKKADIIKLLK